MICYIHPRQSSAYMNIADHIRVLHEAEELHRDLLRCAELTQNDSAVFAFYTRMCDAVNTATQTFRDSPQTAETTDSSNNGLAPNKNN